MLGLAILFGLIVWCIVALIAANIGYKIGKKAHYPKIGAFTGFMLTMGSWIVYWAIEYTYIQAKVTELCEKEGGITVYVTPEQWREQIGEEEWKQSFYTGELDKKYQKRDRNIFNNREYYISSQINQRVLMYKSNDWGKNSIKDVFISDIVIYDTKWQKILYNYRVFSAKSAPNITNSLEGLKFWLDYGIKDCGWKGKIFNENLYSSKKD